MATGGPTVLITGCSAGGIGHALCIAFADAGCNVIATARRMDAMSGLRERGIECAELDVTSDASVRSAQSVIARADILVNNAGQGLAGPMAELSMDEIKKLYDVNFFGLIRMTQAVFPGMAVRGGGKIVNIASIVGAVSTPFGGAYCSSKAAVISASDVMRIELRPFGIDVITVLPGAVVSQIGVNNDAKLPLLPLRFFEPVLKLIQARAQASQTEASTPTDVFAKHVVGRVLAENPPARVWFGKYATLTYVLSWLPVWLTDRIMSKKFGLTQQTTALLKAKAKAIGEAEK